MHDYILILLIILIRKVAPLNVNVLRLIQFAIK